MDPRRPSRSQPLPPALLVETSSGFGQRFTAPFTVGRSTECDVVVSHPKVSRQHLEVALDGGRWILRDLGSGNGTYVAGERVDWAPVDGSTVVTLGPDGPSVMFEPESPLPLTVPSSEPNPADLDERMHKKIFDDDAPAGPQTVILRRVLRQHRRRQYTVFASVVGALVVALVATGVYAYVTNRALEQERARALKLFYDVKALDVEIAKLEEAAAAAGQKPGPELVAYQEQRRLMHRSYDQSLANLNLYPRNLTEQELLVLRVTRLLGECDAAAPAAYIDEVMTYIGRWKSTGRFARGVALASERGYTPRIAQELLAHGLPPQFFYLALQESDFDPMAVGPATRYGYAKGMWQFIPETGRRFGLGVGPLVGVPRADAADERHSWDKATVAAAKYIKEIYTTDAQASALLVMASYNWGEHRIIDRVRELTPNPRERNFWKLRERFRIPDETNGYVLNIVAAAVIGENPRLFGIQVDPPLGFLHGQTSAN
jgi:membrane-bound lytic murein transglycosylase D